MKSETNKLMVLLAVFLLPTLSWAGNVDGVWTPGEWGGEWFIDYDGILCDGDPPITGFKVVNVAEKKLQLAFYADSSAGSLDESFEVYFDIPEAGQAGTFNAGQDALFWRHDYDAAAGEYRSTFGAHASQGGPEIASSWGASVTAYGWFEGYERFFEVEIPFAALSADVADDLGIKVRARTRIGQSVDCNVYPNYPWGQGLDAVTHPISYVTVPDNYAVIQLGERPEVPEPMTLLAVGSAVAGLGGYFRRRRVMS